MGEQIRMSEKDIERIAVLERLCQGELNHRQASAMMRISKRQSQRLKKRYGEGVRHILHQGRGKRSNRQINGSEVAAVMEIVREKYADFGPTLAYEKLKEAGKIGFGVEVLRRAMIAAGLWKSKRRRRKGDHPIRERRPCFGELIQVDGSLHKWFEDRGAICTLLAYIDDATSSVVYAEFVKSESTWAYFEATKRYFRAHGKPLSVYTDKHSVFRVNTSKEGRSATSDSHGDTQYSRALKTLDVEIIYAQTPQAKGRVERLYQTLQDRLVKALRLANISTIEEANGFLPGYLADHNHRFAKDPNEEANLHRRLRPDENLEEIFLIQETRILSKTLTCQYKNKAYQIHHDKANYTLSHAEVRVLEDRDGNISFRYRNQRLRHSVIEIKPINKDLDSKDLNATVDAIKAKLTRNAKKKASSTAPSQPSYKPSLSHPWRGYGYAHAKTANHLAA